MSAVSKNSLRLGSDHATNVQRQHIAWQQNAQEHIDAARDPTNEFRNFVRRLQKGSHKLTSAFQAFRRGRATMHGISMSDFKSVLRTAHVPLNDKQINELFAALDSNNNGTISFDEMVAFVNGKEPMTLKLFGDWQRDNTLNLAAMKAESNRKLHRVDTAAQLKTELTKYFTQQTNSAKGALKVFRKTLQLSGSEDTRISVGNLLTFLHQISMDASRDAIIGLFAQVDADNNGLISLSEFSKFFFGDRQDTGNDYYNRYAVDHIRESKLANVKQYKPSSQLVGDPLKVFRSRIETIKGNQGTRRAFEKLLKLRPTGVIKADKRNISRNEFISIMLRMQIAIPVADLHRVFDALDLNGDQELAFEEFLKFFDDEGESKLGGLAARLGAVSASAGGPTKPRRPPSAMESKIRKGSGNITGLVAVIRRAFARDFFGYYKKLQNILSSLQPQDRITARVIAEMMGALHIHANTAAVTRLHRAIVANLRSETDHEGFLTELFAVCGTTFAKLSAAARARPPSAPAADANGAGGAAESHVYQPSLQDARLMTRALDSNTLRPAKELKRAIVTGTGGYRETMIRLITCLKQNSRYHDKSHKLARSDITVRNLVRAVQDAGILISASVIRQIFAGLDQNASGRISCAKFLRILKILPGGPTKQPAASSQQPKRPVTAGKRTKTRPVTPYAAADNLLAKHQAIRAQTASSQNRGRGKKSLQRALSDARKLAEKRRAQSARQARRPSSSRRPGAASIDGYRTKDATRSRADLLKQAAAQRQSRKLAERHAKVVEQLKSKKRSAAYVRRTF